ncbi:MAG: hypothetical protein GPOALKHO_001869 [Sodalis sp.]|nr:MAG: hypothetical protein GPOALKHO_001869 [Sodalis sp.]
MGSSIALGIFWHFIVAHQCHLFYAWFKSSLSGLVNHVVP